MSTYSIGFTRSDGDFEILATLNNLSEHLSKSDFEALTDYVRDFIEIKGELLLEVLEREDTPSIVQIDEEG
jgi:hypothetical protein